MPFPDDMSGMFDGVDDIFGKKSSKKPEKGVPWEAKVIDGIYYIPLSQVADLLKTNNVLPAVRRGIENRVEAQKLRYQEGL